MGLSPRVRGKPRDVDFCRATRRSIPACAGEAAATRPPAESTTVYPRVCGGSGLSTGLSRPEEGLSPRVRGKLAMAYGAAYWGGSIPACAGEAAGGDVDVGHQRVYPRVCGGSVHLCRLHGDERGLSPRVRGKRTWHSPPPTPAGSIPACAGEAAPPAAPFALGQVYPRVCGGSQRKDGGIAPPVGLSPRVRGKHRPHRPNRPTRWSIPACAGEARGNRQPQGVQPVYPRVCGGSEPPTPMMWRAKGLSPRVRGKLCAAGSCWAGTRSIPACAGEAAYGAAYWGVFAVYPRVCGGSCSRFSQHHPLLGLSPRVRGKRPSVRPSLLFQRSIPACAGEAAGPCAG